MPEKPRLRDDARVVVLYKTDLPKETRLLMNPTDPPRTKTDTYKEGCLIIMISANTSVTY